MSQEFRRLGHAHVDFLYGDSNASSQPLLSCLRHAIAMLCANKQPRLFQYFPYIYANHLAVYHITRFRCSCQWRQFIQAFVYGFTQNAAVQGTSTGLYHRSPQRKQHPPSTK